MCTVGIKKYEKRQKSISRKKLICEKTKLKNPEQKTETFNVPENQCQLLQLINYSPWKKNEMWKKLKDTEVHYNTVYYIT